MHVLIAFTITALVAQLTVGIVEQLAKYNVLDSKSVRKVMHIATGHVFLLTWLLYDDSPWARWLAAAVPAVMSLRFAVVGLGIIQDRSLVASATRTGSRHELLRGPLVYGLVHTALTLAWWRSTPPAIMGITALCAGDGMAEVVGRRAGRVLGPLPYNRQKTVAGTLACVVATAASASAYLVLFQAAGVLHTPLTVAQVLQGSMFCGLVAAAVESVPGLPDGADNALVPLAVAVCASSSIVLG
mmetsp:Transcript_4066/g.10145  ORF Transcript_4066/g.10145 Transcript_4066/m.10145 type:complete len:243 (-) Transcript_4066:141-869(-)